MKFEGWSEDYQRFFIGLELDNSKRYFDANKKTYLERVRGPLEALLAELEPEFGKGKIARPNRDIRFSANKSPYKTNIYAMTPGGYVALDAKGLTAAAGHYEMDKPQLATGPDVNVFVNLRAALGKERAKADVGRGMTMGQHAAEECPPQKHAPQPRQSRKRRPRRCAAG